MIVSFPFLLYIFTAFYLTPKNNIYSYLRSSYSSPLSIRFRYTLARRTSYDRRR